MLKKAGLKFEKHIAKGIDKGLFGEYLFTTGTIFSSFIGLALNENIFWICFHGAYDFAYLLKLATCEPLPDTKENFETKLQIYFKQCYDTKYILKDAKNVSGSLSKVAESLRVFITAIILLVAKGRDSSSSW